METELIIIYKAVNVSILFAVMLFIGYYVYIHNKKEVIEQPKYRMLEED